MIVTIRHAKIEDAHVIAEAEREIAKQPGFFCSQPSELTDENVINTISSFKKSKTGVYLVAEYQNKIVGHAFLEPYKLKSLSHIADLNIAVYLGWQRKGVGKKLLEHLIEWAKSSDILEKIQLNVRASNGSAISLYRKMGFREEGKIKNRVKIKDHYIDDIIMGLDLRDHQVNLIEQDVTIREMQKKDIHCLIETFCFPWSSVVTTTIKWEQYYKEQQEQIRTVFLIEKQAQIIGYASLLRSSSYSNFKDNSIPEINDVWVSAEYRGKGFGKKLVMYLEKMAHQENHKQIGIGVGLYRDYGRAQKLYAQLGFVPDGQGVTYKYQPIVPGESYPIDDDLVMWLKKDLP